MGNMEWCDYTSFCVIDVQMEDFFCVTTTGTQANNNYEESGMEAGGRMLKWEDMQLNLWLIHVDAW